MKPVFVVAAIALVLALAPLGLVAFRSSPRDGLVALELAGAVTTMALVCITMGLGSTASSGVPVVCAAMTWVGGLVIARFLDRDT